MGSRFDVVRRVGAGEAAALLQTNSANNAADVTLLDFPGLHVEVKRDERMSVDAMVRQAVSDAGAKVPVVVWRRNKGKWRADVPLEHYFALLKVLEALMTGPGQ